MTGKIRLLIILSFFLTVNALGQKPAKQPAIDTSLLADYDELFNELDGLLDSLAAPKNFTLVNLGIGSNYFNYTTKASYFLESSRKITYTPSLSYFSKDGWGAAATAVLVNDGVN